MTRSDVPAGIAGVILAGGQSRRMGQDKSKLDYHGRTFLERARALLGETGCGPLRVSGRPDLPGGIPDRQPGAGPACAILDALTAIPDTCTGALFIPVDMPQLDADDLLPLISNNPARACAWAGYPLPAYLPVGGSLPVRAEIRSVKHILAQFDVVWLEMSAGQVRRFSNINTPEDLTSLHRNG